MSEMNGVDLSHLDRLQPLPTRRYVFREIRGKPWVEVRTTDRTNVEYQLARIVTSREIVARAAAEGPADPEDTFSRSREQDLRLFPKMIIADACLYDANGQELPKGAEWVEKYLRKLPDWIFDSLRIFCSDVRNFVPSDAEYDELQVGRMAKN